jgi:hypothetical protein
VEAPPPADQQPAAPRPAGVPLAGEQARELRDQRLEDVLGFVRGLTHLGELIVAPHQEDAVAHGETLGAVGDVVYSARLVSAVTRLPAFTNLALRLERFREAGVISAERRSRKLPLVADRGA